MSVWILATLFAVGIVLIEWTRHRREKAATADGHDFEGLLSSLSAELAKRPSNQIHEAVDRWLQRIAEWLGVELGIFFALPPAGVPVEISPENKVKETLFLNCVEAGERLRRGEVVKAANSRSGAAGFASFCAVPVETDGVTHVLAFASSKANVSWRQNLGPRLTLLAQVFASAVARQRHEEFLRIIAEGVGTARGQSFYCALVRHLAFVLQTDWTLISELVGGRGDRVRTLAFAVDGRIVDNVEYDLPNTPCEAVIVSGRRTYPSELRTHFPHERLLQDMASYSGVALKDASGRSIGLVSVLSRRPLRNVSAVEAMLEIVAVRASGEIDRERVEGELREAEARNRAILTAVPDLMFLLDENGTYLDCYASNPANYYVAPEHFLGRNIREIMPPDFCDDVFRKFEEASSGKTAVLEYSLAINGQLNFYEARIVKRGDGKFLSIVRDVSEKVQAENESKESKRFIERVADTMPSVLLIYDLIEHRNLYVNRQITAALGYAESEIEDLDDNFMFRLAHPDDLPGLLSRCENFDSICDGQVLEVTFRARHKNGDWRWFEGHYAIFSRTADGRAKQVVGTATDITQRKLTEDELQRLSSRLLSFQDEERRKIARDLHDITAQNLFALTLNLECVRKELAAPESRAAEILEECQLLCERSLREIRSFSYHFHPPALDQVGLVSTLRWYVEAVAKRRGLQIELDVAQEIGRLPLEVETDLFRIVQGALANITLYSGNDEATVRVRKQFNQVILEIRDYGQALPIPGGASDASGWLGVGIPGMRERLRQFGGELEIKTSDQGTLLVARVTLSDEAGLAAAHM